MENLYQFYMGDLAPWYPQFSLGPDGRYDSEKLACYFDEEERYPWLIMVDGAPAGFVLVRKVRRNHIHSHSIDEFFVHRQFRRHGVGVAAALKVFGLYPGAWEIGVLDVNERAIAFWKSVLERYSGGDYHEHRNEAAWAGPLYMVGFDELPSGA